MYYGANAQTFEAAHILRRNMTQTEVILWSRLKNREEFRVKFRRQHPVGNFILDFYCHQFKLAIEIEGEIHNLPENIEKDKARMEELDRLGIRILVFTNHQVLNELDSVLSRIHNKLTSLQ
jgi:very-short-patch-repair endonuclease